MNLLGDSRRESWRRNCTYISWLATDLRAWGGIRINKQLKLETAVLGGSALHALYLTCAGLMK